MGQITAFIWFTIIPIAAMLFYKPKAVLIGSIATLLVITLSFFILPSLPEEIMIKLTAQEQFIINVSTVILSLILIFFFVYYQSKINQIKEMRLKEYEAQSAIYDDNDDDITETKTENTEKYNNLYNNIVDYFNEEKPYCNPDFNISQLSLTLNSNVKYISRAIKINRNVNFNVLVNIYRVNMIKEMLTHDFQDKYTISYIYTSVGFRHQSTFNKVFKQIEGITPSEYIKNKNIGIDLNNDHHLE